MAPQCLCSRWTSVTMLLIGFFLSTCMAQDLTTDEQEEYLTSFGYLGDDNPDPEMQELQDHPDRQFELAVRTFQRFAGLNQTGVVDNATIAMMKTPRCGVADTLSMGGIVRRRRKRYTLTGDRWNKLHLTYRFLGYTPDLPQATIRSVFVQAFKMWSEVSALTFSETNQVPDIEIMFAARSHGDGYPFDGRGGTLAHAFFPNSRGSAIAGDAHFDEDEQWTDSSYSGTNLLQVAVHEIGHSLGLGHSDVQNSIMAPFYRGYKPGFTLDKDDIDGIRHLYGQGGTGAPGGPPTSIGPPTTTTPRDGVTPSTLPPDYCPLAGFCRDFDAIDVIRNTVYAFKGENYARLSSRGVIIDVGRIQDTWPALPTHLDAVMSTYRFVYFFKGAEYWRMTNTVSGPEINSLTRRRISSGFPGAPTNMDAAFVWSGNGRIYFIRGSQYWRYRGRYGVDRGYPKSLSIWRNVRRPVDDVFQYYGVTYFFSGTGYQVFNDYRFNAGSPRSTKDLMQCCTREQELLAQKISTTPSDSWSSTAPKSASHSQLGFMLLLLSAVSALL